MHEESNIRLSESDKLTSDPNHVNINSSISSSTRKLSDRVLAAAKSTRSANYTKSIKSLTLCQLRINMKLHGREDDIKLLRSKLLELKNNEKKKEVPSIVRRLSSLGSIPGNDNTDDINVVEMIFICGTSGVGKSALVMKGLRDPAEKMGLKFVYGKFDNADAKASLPLSAFCDAMASLTKIIIEEDILDEKIIQHEISNTFEEQDLILLNRALPGCEELFPLYTGFMGLGLELFVPEKDANPNNNHTSNNDNMNGRDAIPRLQFAIRRLLKIICTHLKCVVFIDDLQWSDTATLDLLQSISLDSDIPSLLLVGAYREDEVPHNHPLALQIREKEQMGIAFTTIRIGNLSLANVTSLIAEALGMEDDKDAVQPLAVIVHKKTDGNAFFVLMFLRSLHNEQLLQFNIGAYKWTWDMEAVEAKLATENVATMLVDKLKRLDKKTQRVLKVASCLGSKFSLSAVAVITDSLSHRDLRRLSSSFSNSIIDKEPDEAISLIDLSIKDLEVEGLWTKDDTEDVWHFGHDRIQAAAFELISRDKRDTFRGRLGAILLKKLNPEALEASLFAVVSLLNCQIASISDDEQRLEFAKLNLRAGRKASANAAFDSAAAYYTAGREVLGSNGWDIDQRLMLSLCSEGARASFICGDVGASKDLIAEVIRQDDITIEDKYAVYDIKVKVHYAASEFDDSINTAFDFRKQIGLPTLKNRPVSMLIVLKEFLKTNRAMGKRLAEDIASLPELTDERVEMGQRMLELATTSSFVAQPTLFPLIVILMVRASLKHGINASACDAFGGYGIILCALGKLNEGTEMSKAVEFMLANPNMSRMRSRSTGVCKGFIYHWLMPLQGTLAPLLEGYQIGLRIGDIESAAQNLYSRTNHLYFSGRPLDKLEDEFQASVDAISQLKQENKILTTKTFMLMVKKLRGGYIKSDMDQILKIALEIGDRTLRALQFLARMELSVFFYQWKVAADMLVRGGDLKKGAGGLFGVTRTVFLQGLISIHATREANTIWKKRRWKKKAIKSTKQIRSWVQKGAVNIVHNLHLLTAELAALEGKHHKAEENYKAAITVATRNGFLQDRALSHELASVYFSETGDEYWAKYHLDRCLECYSAWGATAKVVQLMEGHYHK